MPRTTGVRTLWSFEPATPLDKIVYYLGHRAIVQKGFSLPFTLETERNKPKRMTCLRICPPHE